MKLKNFKGIQELEIIPKGKNISIYGDNGSGKTTIFDACWWLLFDKDSTGRTKFEVKTLVDGETLHHLEHTVEASLSIDGTSILLKKTLEEKWVRTKGQEHAKFDGHTTSYWIDEVPTKSGDYSKKIAGLINEELFKLITSVGYFSNKLTWDKRRNVLFEISGVTNDDQAVIDSSPELKKIEGFLAGRSVEDYKKVLSDKIKETKEDIENIPPRIDELSLTIPTTEIDFVAAEKDLEEVKLKIAAIEKEQSTYNDAAQSTANIVSKLELAKLNLSKRMDVLNSSSNDSLSAIVAEKSKLEREKLSLANTLLTTIDARGQLKISVFRTVDIMSDMRISYDTILLSCMPEMDEHTKSCPACGQGLPQENLQEKLNQLKLNFEVKKKAEIDTIISHGNVLKKTLIENEATLKKYDASIEEAEKELAQVDAKIIEISAKLAKPSQAVDVESDSVIKTTRLSIASYETELAKPTEAISEELISTKKELGEKAEELIKVISRKDDAAKIKARIAELRTDHKTLSARLAEYEGQRYLLEQFTKAKVGMIEGSINSKFKFVKFKLFDTQINGAIVECCEATIDGVPYSEANNAARINAGIDIINALCEYHNCTAPIFVDNAESVNELLATNSQLVRLVVLDPKELEKIAKLKIELAALGLSEEKINAIIGSKEFREKGLTILVDEKEKVA